LGRRQLRSAVRVVVGTVCRRVNTGGQALLEHNAKVYLAARNKRKAELAIEELRRQTGKEAIFLELNLADLGSVKAAAEEFLRCVWWFFYLMDASSSFGIRNEKELHILFNNGYVHCTFPKSSCDLLTPFLAELCYRTQKMNSQLKVMIYSLGPMS